MGIIGKAFVSTVLSIAGCASSSSSPCGTCPAGEVCGQSLLTNAYACGTACGEEVCNTSQICSEPGATVTQMCLGAMGGGCQSSSQCATGCCGVKASGLTSCIDPMATDPSLVGCLCVGAADCKAPATCGSSQPVDAGAFVGTYAICGTG